ncbi:MAG TPA: hypothetical protein VK162_26485 [Streptosporangiaceae bacterium]|nr:hypothetical protein [Streptosporangiaceae bacterium]
MDRPSREPQVFVAGRGRPGWSLPRAQIQVIVRSQAYGRAC